METFSGINDDDDDDDDDDDFFEASCMRGRGVGAGFTCTVNYQSRVRVTKNNLLNSRFAEK